MRNDRLVIALVVGLILGAAIVQARGATGWRLVAEATWTAENADACAKKRAQAYRILKTTGAVSMRVRCLTS